LTAAVEERSYPIEDLKMLYVIQDGGRLPELIKFMTDQVEVDYVSKEPPPK
jgi:hypothetical protein